MQQLEKCTNNQKQHLNKDSKSSASGNTEVTASSDESLASGNTHYSNQTLLSTDAKTFKTAGN